MNDEQKAPLDFNAPEGAAAGGKKLKWAAFVESVAADFFTKEDLEKMSIEDGRGNKAKLSRTKDNSIKIEYSSTMIL